MEKTKRQTLKIGITGPESCGKTSLAESLVKKLGGLNTTEIARKYLTDLSRPYDLVDLGIILKLQNQHEDLLLSQKPDWLFCDTTPQVIEIWAWEKFGMLPPNTCETDWHKNYHLHLLCSPDLLWEPDPLREDAENREKLFIRYENWLKTNKLHYAIIKGQGENRVENAVNAIRSFLG